MWSYFCLGLLVGWLVEWLIDWFYWRKRCRVDAQREQAQVATAAGSGGSAAGAAATGAARAGVSPAAAATAAGLVGGASSVVSHAPDDLTAIEGIGPKIAELLKDNGIRTFADLAAAPMQRLVGILDAGGSRFRLANPDTWPEQASLAARGDWAAFAKLKDELTGGVRVNRE
ncbi:MAG: hypothetical protein H6934_09010 [Burkholderiaceae bacterium]|nr:hypothetical protein [Burkholderiaceae bacterium]